MDPISTLDPAGVVDVSIPDAITVSPDVTPSAAVTGSEGADRPGLIDDLGTLSSSVPARSLPRAMAATDDPFRIAAILRVWALRDAELCGAGDATPQRIAERIAAGTVPAPDPPTRACQLAYLQHTQSRHADPGQAPWCEPDQQLVTGRPREELRQWLDAMVWCTPKQLRDLDGFTQHTTLPDVRAFLTGEGFVEVLDVHGNADTGTGRVDLILVNTSAGWLATVHATDAFDLGTTPFRITVYYNVAALDSELLVPREHSGGWYFDTPRRRTNIWCGSVTVHPQSRWPQRSLRVELAVLRAFGRPVTPWVETPHVHIGADGTPAEWRTVLIRLPAHIQELFGPCLMPSLPA